MDVINVGLPDKGSLDLGSDRVCEKPVDVLGGTVGVCSGRRECLWMDSGGQRLAHTIPEEPRVRALAVARRVREPEARRVVDRRDQRNTEINLSKPSDVRSTWIAVRKRTRSTTL